MKKSTQLLIFLLLCSAFAKAELRSNEIPCIPPSKSHSSSLSKVTVFLSGAQIERTAEVAVTSGTNEFLFDNLSNDIDENSIQISGLGNASILSISFGINHLTEKLNSDKVDSLNILKRTLETQILRLNSTIRGLKKEEEIIDANKRLGSDVTEIDLVKIKELSSYYRTRITQIKNEILDAEMEKTELQHKVTDISKQFNELNVSQEKSKGQITLKLNSKQQESLNLIIKYHVKRAGWYPEYDLKAIATDAPLDLSYKAHIYQKTGVNWDHVNLILSTGDPNTNNLKPNLETKYLHFVNQYYRNNARATKAYNYKYNPTIKTISGIVSDENGPLPGAIVLVKGTLNATETDFDGRYSLQVDQGEQLEFSFVGYTKRSVTIHSGTINMILEASNELDEVVVTAKGTRREKKALGYAVNAVSGEEDVAMMLNGKASGVAIRGYSTSPTATGDIKTEGLTNTTFEIQEKYTIPSDGDVTVIEIDKFQVPATYEYFVAPAVNENVFLTASITNWARYSLLPGEANIYFEGSFSGKTFINPLETTEELSVSLGVDPNIIVKRKQLDNFKSTSFIGTQRIVNMEFAITVKNNKSKAIQLLMVDRIPISQNKEIKVSRINTGNASYDEDTGMMQWNVALAPIQTDKRTFGYELKYPKHKSINL